ncbi:helicase-related protein [Rhodococcus opacus]|uniref:helicase-related protein n=1 Tax=Rhodococcus opacus TaxID=37919 RepID=UPI0002A29806|nr:helicase-related protein [Rhodococcus opacus]ELB87600.1 helicase domain-containing protein [Rhodococcus wratislaviensis IFP 2016]MDX5962857.1 helicase-related protein [Rhodococcus opacus]CAG7637155.1 RNA polymerase-associated protein RapA [Rhodococcus opacus]
MTTTEYPAGTLVHARARDWLVLPGAPDGLLLARPLGGRDDETTVLIPEIDIPTPAVFTPPTVDDRGDAARARLLRNALRLSFRATGGPFRSFGNLAVTPRNYQLVPLMMSTAQDTTRLLIADGVGVGKTIEAGLIASELLATGDAQRLAVLCSPQLAPQWQAELRTKFGIEAQLLLPSTAKRLKVPWGSTIYEHYPYLVISTDFIKQRSRRDEFALNCPELVIVDEAHTCVAATTAGSSQAHLRYSLLRKIADDPTRHLLLLTATPHSGDDGAWQSLIGLLDDRLGDLPADLSGREREEDRKLLAKFMIQRGRADIREYLHEDTPFPTRESTETSYKLTPGYRALFDDVMAFAREQVSDPKLNTMHQRVRWWSAIALLRCLASSPAAAQQTLLNRSALASLDAADDVDAIAAPRVLDTDLDDVLEGDDTILGSDTSDPETTSSVTRRRLRELAASAAALRGPKSDAKLKRLITLLQDLLADGYHPIVFCRYIPTADYLAEHLAGALTKKNPNLRVEAVTGTLPPEERETRVGELSEHPGPRLLIATDCLSEGINLQDGFTAVVHYDLAWNPTRHEQREGRVDRFGQRAGTVRTVTYYGEDNGIDGIVLKVLIQRHENIRRSTGMSVPVPVDSTTVMNAIWESLLLRGNQTEQLALDFAEATSTSLADAVGVQWVDAAEREKASRSRFRQAGLQPDAVADTLTQVRRSLGGPADAETFTRDALSLLSAQIGDTDDGFTARIDTVPAAVRDQLPPSKDHRLIFHRSFPVPTGHSVLTRTDHTVEALSRYVLDSALDADANPTIRPARRASVVRSSGIDKVTTLLVVRFRLEIVLPGSRTTITQVAEDAQFLAYTANGEELTWLQTDDVNKLLSTPATGNVADTLARTQLDRALSRLDDVREHLLERGHQVAEDIVTDHRTVRAASKTGGRAVKARLLPPPDVLGVYVFLPERSAS